MKLEIIFVIFAFLLVGTIQYQSFAQSNSLATHVVINEIDINPPGSDYLGISEWVELYNPADRDVNLGNWEIASTTVLKKTMIIPDGTTIKPGQHLKFQYQSIWFTDVSERVELRDDHGNIVDETPSLSDIANDFSSWQRVYDGFDTDSSDDWEFKTSTAGSTNGKLVVEEIESKTSISVSTDKSNYIFDETVIISGAVSEQVFTEAPFFHQEPIELLITGPNYYKTLTLYPNLFLGYETSIKLQKVLGINEGIYDVNVSYAGIITSTQFSVGTVLIEIEQQEVSSLTIKTDKESYIPGETATIFAQTSEIVPFEGLKFQVFNAGGIKIYQGTLYPNVVAVNSAIGDSDTNPLPDAQFTTTIFMDIVSPSYGPHNIVAQYGTQAATGTFVLNEDVKEEKLISLRTDKPVYGLGETVVISGRLNNLFIYSMDLEILQSTTALSTEPLGRKGLLDQDTTGILKIFDIVRLEGDSSFSYEFTIPTGPDGFGDYRVTVSKDVGSETIFFKVVDNPEEFVDISVPFFISTNKLIYDIGERMVIFGNVANLQSRSSFETLVVSISITDEDGNPLTILALLEGAKSQSRITDNAVACYTLTGIPDIVGNFRVEDTISPSLYKPGTYYLKAIYSEAIQGIRAAEVSACPNFDQVGSDVKATTSFSVVDPLEIEGGFLLQLNKEVFGLGETVLLDGIVPNISQGTGIQIILIKPDGDTDKFGTLADQSRFSWSWDTPRFEKTSSIENDRALSFSNYGVYRVIVGSDSSNANIFFKVSPNPEQDTLQIEPLSVTTDKAVYSAGETMKVIGTAIKRVQGTEGLVVPERAQIIIKDGTFPFKQILDSSVYLDTGGRFESSFVLPVTVFKEGNYKATAIYQGLRAETLFSIDNDFNIGGDVPLAILINTDKEEYGIGDTVQITGRPTKIVYLENISVTVVQEDELQLTCGSFICGRPEASTPVVTDPSGAFTHEYKIPSTDDAKGVYEIIVDTEFGVFSSTFLVTEQATLEKELREQLVKGKRTTEKVNRIPDTFVPIFVAEKTLDGAELVPRVLQGLLLTPTRGEESNVNIKITTEDGTCIIGQESGCMVSDSTRAPGTIYQVVEIDGKNYNVRYSGPDARLEKFTILPESSIETLPDSTWNVEVIKDEQPSRLYYKITYITIE